MIFAITIISVLAFALTNIFAKKTWQTILSVIFAAIFLVSLGFITANDHYHYGMKKVTETTTQTLTSSVNSKKMNLLLYQPLGNGTEKVYLYKTNESQKKPKPTGTDHVTNVVKKNQANAQLQTAKTYWVYKNDTAKLWFGLSSKNHQLIKEKNTFNVKEDWLVLSTDQAKKLAKLVQKNKDSMQTAGKAFVQEKVKAAMMKNPTMDQAAQQKIIQQATAEYQQQAMAKIIAEVTK
ncbi:MAG: DUF4811 domain-containing protein [Enterococcus viikkiensis]|uniref:DUF4811 domain-containing protein n=1 Tax=Enterococcus viikkiensis TaxID=930854 RepID=A0ABU3FRQ3_9ENTE|nr:DUF4811 domain-containing protein [Enterococcus viikkiensis]MDT2828663.1 DUF4811 domain-containing protein [Enterococcus viikkiensis]